MKFKEIPLTNDGALYPQSYEDSRERFRQNLDVIRRRWPGARLRSFPVSEAEDLTIDWIEAQPAETYDKLVIVTTGEHGIEGYVGSAMLQLFIQEQAPLMNSKDTGLLLVHAINPWGMKKKRRVNRNNVDLNRNFIWQASPAAGFEAFPNPDYRLLNRLWNPEGPVGWPFFRQFSFVFKGLFGLARLRSARFQKAVLGGQYSHPLGIYYGGASYQAETKKIMELYRAHIGRYKQVVHLDMHTGYGPRRQMTIVNSNLEPRSSKECSHSFGYPRVSKTDASEFYAIHGDMIDYVYRLAHHEFPQTHLYATSFEFGTFGATPLRVLRSLQTTILENQLYRFGARSQAICSQVEHDYLEMFFPQDLGWQVKAAADARQAFRGILKAEKIY